jgi:hypothetical protein
MQKQKVELGMHPLRKCEVLNQKQGWGEVLNQKQGWGWAKFLLVPTPLL